MISVVSLFSGAGGLDLGFKDEGFDLVYAVDNDLAAIDCYRRNLGDHIAFHDISSDAFHDEVLQIGSCDVVLGGFPCQGFSKAGPKRADDDRNTLYRELHSVVNTLRPSMFVAENVDGIAQNFHGSYIRKIEADFRGIGYRISSRLLNAVAFGVPQYRRRIFFVGIREDLPSEFLWPALTHRFEERNGEFRSLESTSQQLTLFGKQMPGTVSAAPLTLRDAIYDIQDLSVPLHDHEVSGRWPDNYRFIMQKIGPGQKLCNVRHAKTSVKTWEIPEVFGAVTERQRVILVSISLHRRRKRYGDIPNGNPIAAHEIERLCGQQGISRDLRILENMGYLKAKNGGYDLKGAMFCSGLFKRPLWDEPSPTVLTNFSNPRYFLHPSVDRPFTLRECARLQGFPDTFRFIGDRNAFRLEDGYRLVGNAVPPPLARHIARAVRETLSTGESERVA